MAKDEMDNSLDMLTFENDYYTDPNVIKEAMLNVLSLDISGGLEISNN